MRLIAQALETKKITPASADYHRACCSTAEGLKAFTAYCSAAPTLLADNMVAAGAPGEGAQGASRHYRQPKYHVQRFGD